MAMGWVWVAFAGMRLSGLAGTTCVRRCAFHIFEGIGQRPFRQRSLQGALRGRIDILEYALDLPPDRAAEIGMVPLAGQRAFRLDRAIDFIEPDGLRSAAQSRAPARTLCAAD